jgi:hypothetical protein
VHVTDRYPPVPVIQIDNDFARQNAHSQFTGSVNFARAFNDNFPRTVPLARTTLSDQTSRLLFRSAWIV